MKNSEQYPKPHAKYIVRRDGILFTATPCYGMHEPWWVVRVMGEKYEADPEPMLETDEWWPVDESKALVQSGAGEQLEQLITAARGLIEYRQQAGPLSFQLEKADTFIFRMRVALESVGDPSNPSDVGN